MMCNSLQKSPKRESLTPNSNRPKEGRVSNKSLYALEAPTCLKEILQRFEPISLEKLKSRAALMDRRDNKYILSTNEVIRFFNRAESDFYILEIDSKRQFHYLSTYYDSPNLGTHQDHNQGRRRRIKLRHRHYIDSRLHYFEIKLKGFRNLTHKFRTPLIPEKLPATGLNPRLKDFIFDTLAHHYDPDFAKEWVSHISPSISVGYHRITLVSKKDNKRITLDNGIYFIDESLPKSQKSSHYLHNNRWIVEVKSATGRTALDRWLLSNRRRPVSACSKYGMGISLLKTPEENNRFRKTLRRYFGRT